MKKKGVIGFLLFIVVVGGMIGFSFYKKGAENKSTENHFVGFWEKEESETMKQIIEIRKNNTLIHSAVFKAEGIENYRTTYIYKDVEVSKDKIVATPKEIAGFEMEYVLSDELAEVTSLSGGMETLVDTMFRQYLTEKEIKKYLSVDDKALHLTIDDAKAAKKMTDSGLPDDINMILSLKEDNVLDVLYDTKEKTEEIYRRISESKANGLTKTADPNHSVTNSKETSESEET